MAFIGFIGGFMTPTSLDAAPTMPLIPALAINLGLLTAFAVLAVTAGTTLYGLTYLGAVVVFVVAAAVAGLRGMFRQSGAITAVSVTAAIMARSAHPGIAQGPGDYFGAAVVSVQTDLRDENPFTGHGVRLYPSIPCATGSLAGFSSRLKEKPSPLAFRRWESGMITALQSRRKKVMSGPH